MEVVIHSIRFNGSTAIATSMVKKSYIEVEYFFSWK